MSGKLVVGDCIEAMARLPAEWADLIFADPPFNIGLSFDICKDRWRREDYLSWIDQWLPQLVRILKPSGSLWLCIGYDYVCDYKIKIDSLGLKLINWIVWHRNFERQTKRRFALSHCHILYYVVNENNYTFNFEEISIPTLSSVLYNKNRYGALRYKVPSDVWYLRPNDAENLFRSEHDVWFFPRAMRNERVSHPTQKPEALLERIIRVATNPGDLVVDPFAGSGTTLAVAKRLGRRFWGCELSPRYANVIVERLRGLFCDEIEVEYLRLQREVISPAAKPS